MMMKVAVSFAAASSLAWGSHDNGALAFVFAPCGVFTPRRQNRRRPQHPNLLRMVATDPTSAFEDSLLTAVAPSSSSEFSPSADVFVADAMMLEISSAGGSSSTAGAAAPQPTAPFPEDGGGDGTTVVVPGLEPREQRRRLSLPPQLVPLLQDPVLTGRALVVAASAIYGTNFATVKMLNAELPTSAAAALRFSLAAAAVLTALAMKEAGRGGGEFAAADTVDRADRGPASLLGFEVGIWYCFGYLFQAWGLHTVDASKVRRRGWCCFLRPFAVALSHHTTSPPHQRLTALLTATLSCPPYYFRRAPFSTPWPFSSCRCWTRASTRRS